MLSFRSPTARSPSGSSDSHTSLPPSITISSIRRKPLRPSGIKSSLRHQLKGITGNLTGRRRPRPSRTEMPHDLDPWHKLTPNDDLLNPVSANVQHTEAAGQTWPAIRKSISSMASTIRTNYESIGHSSSGETSHQPSTGRSKLSFKGSQKHARRWVTMATRTPPVALKQSTKRARRSSFSTISELVSRQEHESIPQLPTLAESSNFLDSLARTGLFRLFTPTSEINNTPAGGFKVQNTTELNGEPAIGYGRPFVARLPLRLRNPESLCQRVRRGNPPGHAGNNLSQANNENEPPRLQQRTTPLKDKFQTPFCSRHPVEWLDRILETSYATRNPISPKLCVSKETMAFLCKSKTCFYVEYPKGLDVPEPQKCYPGFKAALEDIVDRFGSFYAPFAGYNCVTRMITLYARDTPRPENKKIDEDTAIFDLEKARSAWVKPSKAYTFTSCPGTKTPSRETSEDLTENSDQSRSSSEETGLTDMEDYYEHEHEVTWNSLKKKESKRHRRPSFLVDNKKDEEDVVDEEMASRLNYMG
ncbi:hypothetical protein F5Y08DRAFT_350624 [Xylaria arbuscula]|nr:hypothetical protein F5Y08DRAFT_350624 [Xylaria arbuscula]